MSRRVDFWDNLNPLEECFLDDLLYIFKRVSSFRRESTIFRDIRERMQRERERFRISDVPMQDIQFIVEHCIDSIQNCVH